MSQTYVLVVEDDPAVQRLLASQLKARGFRVRVVGNGEEALTAVADEEPSIVILDIGLPADDGVTVCRTIREWSAVPIIMLTAAQGAESKLKAFEVGADDYLTKPFNMSELVARMTAILRRSRSEPITSKPYLRLGDLEIDLRRRQVSRSGVPVVLTKTEFNLLLILANHVDTVLTYEFLLKAVWGPGYFDIRPIHVHISNLRRKLQPNIQGPRYIIAIPGVGYRLETPASEVQASPLSAIRVGRES